MFKKEEGRSKGAKTDTIMRNKWLIRIKLCDDTWIFFHDKEKNDFKGMVEHKLPSFTILDLGCSLSKDGPAIQENKVKFFKWLKTGIKTYWPLEQV